MIRLQIPAVISLACWLFCGCGPDQAAKEIAQRRSGGDLIGARTAAVDVLAKRADNLHVWRELAAVDAQICVNAARQQVDGLPYLLESARICAVVCQYKSGDPGEKWASVARQVSSLTATYFDRLLKNLPVQKLETLLDDESVPGRRQQPVWKPITPEKQIDMAAAAPVFRAAFTLRTYLEMLPAEGKNAQIWLTQMDETVSHLPDRYPNITAAMLTEMQTGTEAEVKQAISDAVADLKDMGYIDASNLASAPVTP